HLAAAERPRRARCARVLAGIEGIAAATTARACRLLNDRRGACDLLLRIALLRLLIAALRLLAITGLRCVAALRRRLAIGRAGLRRRHSCHIGLDLRRSARRRHAGAELAQPLLELAGAVVPLARLARGPAAAALPPVG